MVPVTELGQKGKRFNKTPETKYKASEGTVVLLSEGTVVFKRLVLSVDI